jgi:hypothetical protein
MAAKITFIVGATTTRYRQISVGEYLHKKMQKLRQNKLKRELHKTLKKFMLLLNGGIKGLVSITFSSFVDHPELKICTPFADFIQKLCIHCSFLQYIEQHSIY